MELIEIVLQGLAGFPQTARVQLGPALTVATPSNLQQCDTVVDVTLDLLGPSTLENPVLPLVVTSADASRSGIHLRGRDGADYRVLKDVRAGRTTLMRQQGTAMAPMSQEAQEIARALTAQVGFPLVEVYRRVFVLRACDLPSKTGVTKGDGAKVPEESTSPGDRLSSFADQPLPPGFSQEESAPAYDHLSDDDKRRRLEEIKGQIEQGQKVRELEFKLDGLQKRAFDLEEKARPIAKLRDEVQTAKQSLERFADVVDVPSDFRAQIDRAMKIRQSHANEMAELERRQKSLEEQHAIAAKEKGGLLLHARMAFKDKLVQIGLASGCGAIAIAAIGGSAGIPLLQWVAFADIPAFFVALLGGLRAIAFAEEKDQARIQLQRVMRDKEKLRAKAELDATAFDALLAKYGLSSRNLEDVDQAVEQLEHKRSLTVKLEGAQERLNAALADPDAQDIETKLAGHREQVKVIEEELYEAGGYLVDPATLQAEARALEEALSHSMKNKAAPGASPNETATVALDPAALPDGGAPQKAREVSDIIGGILDACADLLSTSPATLTEKITPRLSQYIGGMSGQRLTGVQFIGAKDLKVMTADGREIVFADLDPPSQDLVYVALQLTAAEVFARSTRMPLIIDRALDVFGQESDALHVRLVQFLANHTQVFLLTERETLAAGATTRLTL